MDSHIFLDSHIRFAADIGNSRIKLQIYEEVIAIHYGHDWQRELTNELKKISSYKKNDRELVLYFSSVRNDIANILATSALDLGITVKNIIPILNKISILDYSSIRGIGSDRLMSLMGALSIGKGPFATVDCGTAVTVNFLKGNNKVVGGYIFAGAYTQINALAEKAEALSESNLKFEEIKPGKTTESAISRGISASVTGAITLIISNYILSEKLSEEPFHVYFTGGYGKEILNLFNLNGTAAIYFNNLVLRGILETSQIYERQF